MNWKIKPFNELTTIELYELMRLRQEVFIIEQDCNYLDADGKDLESYHVLGYDSNELAAYARVVKPGISYKEVAVGRVIVKESHRSNKLGYELMQICHDFISTKLKQASIRLSAQSHLESFYRNCGYEPTGKEYLEDNIPHKEMLRAE